MGRKTGKLLFSPEQYIFTFSHTRVKNPPKQSYRATDPIHKGQLFYFFSVIVQISLPSLTLEKEFFSI